MPDTPVPHALRSTRRRLALTGLAIVLLGLVAAAVVTLRVEPMRAALWHAVGPSCGQVQLPPPGRSGTHDNRAAEACFAQAYARCQAASLTASQLLGVDTASADTYVVEPAILGPCGLAVRWESLVDAGFIRQGGTLSCAGLTAETDGLLVRGCGSAGETLLPLEG
jgi:hypothetical protein